VSDFSADWLALREPHDLRARSGEIVSMVAALLDTFPSLQIVDLACGTGSTLRALSPHLPVRQYWRLVDNDLGLLGRAKATPLAKHVTVAVTPLDLNRDLEAALDGPTDLVTTSALLDLVSNAWLDRLVVEIAARSIPFYASLTYDGRVEIAPHDSADAAIIAAINTHQTIEKGFGRALGPAAAKTAIAGFERVGYTVTHRRSDWTIGPRDRDIQEAVFSGWAHAAREIGLPFAESTTWLARRRDFIAAGASSLRVGHLDLLAAPTDKR
jgi:hypothetical protein